MEKKKKRRLYKKPLRQLKTLYYRLANYVCYPLSPWRGKIVNDKEIRVFGLQRSGNHTIINWLYAQSEEVRCFLNFVAKGRNPFLTFNRKGTVREFQPDFYRKFAIHREKTGWFCRKKLLMYSYEDEFLADCVGDDFENNHDRWVGKSGQRFDVLILRDPFNLFASRLKKEDDFRKNRYSLRIPVEREILIGLWKSYAREFLGETNILPNNKVTINYNRWSREPDYRRELAVSLGFPGRDSSVREVLPIGGGSSFDRTNYNESASEMKVLERWRYYQDDEFFRSLFRDRELIELAEKIFGRLDGIEKLLAN